MKNFFKNKFGKIAVVSAAGIGSASATVPTAVSDAISTAGTDAATMATSVLVAIVGVYAIKLLRRAL